MGTRSSGNGTRPVVTLWETYGCGMAEVAAKVAAAMGLTVSDQAFSSEDLQGMAPGPERESGLDWILALIDAGTQGTREIVRSGPGRSGGGRSGGGRPGRDPEEAVAENTEHVLAVARGGGVILGRNGAFILRDRPNTLHVKLDGPLDARIARAAENFRLTPEQAATRQRIEDGIRSEMSLRLYGWNPLDNGYYDLVLNTALLGVEAAARVIVATAEIKATAEITAAAPNRAMAPTTAMAHTAAAASTAARRRPTEDHP